MSLPPHREKDAKAEGRGPPETVKGTMAPFRSLMGRLLNVRPEEMKEQQERYENYKPAVPVGKGAKSLAPIFSGHSDNSPSYNKKQE